MGACFWASIESPSAGLDAAHGHLAMIRELIEGGALGVTGLLFGIAYDDQACPQFVGLHQCHGERLDDRPLDISALLKER